MRIERLELLHLKIDLLRPFETSSSRKTYREHVLVKVHAEGLVGWGECPSSSDPYYCPETTETCWHVLRDFLAPSVLGQPWESIAELVARYARVKGHHFAKSGLEMACWDLLARAQGRPLHALLGGTRAEIHSGVSLGIEADPDRLLELVDQFVAQGYRRVKLKIAPGKDVPVVARVRERYPELPLMVDANSAYGLQDLPRLKELDAFGLMMIEQPLAYDDIVDHARLQRALRTPICLDESIHSAEDARRALELGSCRIINIKVSRLGGLLEARKVHDLCYRKGVPVWCGGMHEYGIGRAANVAISSLPGFVLPGDISGSDKYYAHDIVAPPILATDGAIPVPTGPGLGVEPDEQRIRGYT
ncbi:MAG: o-succinylbenzoate synthase, partial [Chloroflexi bacterium]|nr:o-succinylbenzoate synthase [Chloroflexota bacterium]